MVIVIVGVDVFFAPNVASKEYKGILRHLVELVRGAAWCRKTKPGIYVGFRQERTSEQGGDSLSPAKVTVVSAASVSVEESSSCVASWSDARSQTPNAVSGGKKSAREKVRCEYYQKMAEGLLTLEESSKKFERSAIAVRNLGNTWQGEERLRRWERTSRWVSRRHLATGSPGGGSERAVSIEVDARTRTPWWSVVL
jgi:hypothetical protein